MNIFVSGMAADATKETMILPLAGLGDGDEAAKSSWSVLVSIQRFSWVIKDPMDSATLPWRQIDFSRPIVPLIATEVVAHLFAGLYHAPQIRFFADFEKAGVEGALLSALHFDLDGHSANLPMVALRRQELLEETRKLPAVSSRHCGNHAQCLIDNCVIDSSDSSIHTWFTCGSAFFRMGGDFLRLIHVVFPYVDRSFETPVLGAPPFEASRLTQEIRSYSLANFKTYQAAEEDPWSDDEVGDEDPDDPDRKRKTRAGYQALEKAWDAFQRIFNGVVWAEDCRLAHYTDVLKPLQPLKREAATAIATLMFRALPGKMMKGKWTTKTPCLSWWMTAMVLNMVFNLWDHAYASFTVSHVKKPRRNCDPPDIDPDSVLHEIDWHKLQGNRCKYVKAGFSVARSYTIIFLALVFEPLTFLHKWFMRRTSAKRRMRGQMVGETPPICDLVRLECGGAGLAILVWVVGWQRLPLGVDIRTRQLPDVR